MKGRIVGMTLSILALALDCQGQEKDLEALRRRMVEEFIVAEGVTNPRVLDAMRRTPRHLFMPPEALKLAYLDMGVPIGKAQTISSPYIVAYMTEQLDPQPDDVVLEIGTGSGYQAAVLSPLVKSVCTIEIVEELGKRAAKTLQQLKYDNVHAKVADGFKGWPEKAPFDKIIVTCSPENIPQPLVDQLKEGGRLIVPLGERYQQTLYRFIKKDGKLVAQALAPTMFVPMMGQAEKDRKVKSDTSKPQLVNGGFEKVDESSGKVSNWYYQRQLTVENLKAPEGKRFVTFGNRYAGRSAQALQAFPIDGQKFKVLNLSCSVKGDRLRSGNDPQDFAGVIVIFYDQDRKPLENATLGSFFGTFDWRQFQKQIPVPEKAKEALICIGLQGALGDLSFDALTLKVGP